MPYLVQRHKLADAGLQLRLPVDLVPPTQYSRLSNAVPKIEGLIQTRDGTTRVSVIVLAAVGTTPPHTVYRLNQDTAAIAGERLVGAGTRLFSAPIPSGDVFSELTGLSFDGGPLSILGTRFDQDQASWAVIGNSAGMRKRRQPSFYQQLGLPRPVTPATATDGGVGNLNSDGGTGYDWRYTYLNETTRSESNPSDINKIIGEQRPTAFTNPDPVLGGTAITDPTNAIDDNDATFALAQGNVTGLTTQSCQYHTWGAAGTVDDLTLEIDAEVLLVNEEGDVRAAVQYSLDGGSTWSTVFDVVAAATRNVYKAELPPAIDLSKLRVRCIAQAYVAGAGPTPPDGPGEGGGGGTEQHPPVLP